MQIVGALNRLAELSTPLSQSKRLRGFDGRKKVI